MIPIQQEHEHYSGKSKETTGFKMAHSNKSFKILSSGLYSNKVLAVLREYLTNAYDSHADKGIKDQPFRVHLPTKLEPWFEVEDFGIGLSKEDVINIYTVFFTSTKVNDNDTNGCLGLGSKSAYAVSDQFTITAIKYGVKVIYSCYISREGFPTADLKHEVNTLEGDGVTVRIPVAPNECYKWVNEWCFVSSPYEVLPTTNYKEDDQYDITLKSKLRSRIKDSRNNKLGVVDLEPDQSELTGKCYALMGNVLYKIEDSVQYLRTKDLVGLYNQLSPYSFVLLHFDIGEVDIAPSRESLSFDPTTIRNVQKKLTKLVNSYYKTKVEEFGGIDTNNYYKLYRKFKDTPLWEILLGLVFPFTKGSKLRKYEEIPWRGINRNKFFPLEGMTSEVVRGLIPRVGNYYNSSVTYSPNLCEVNHRRLREISSPSLLFSKDGATKNVKPTMEVLKLQLEKEGKSPNLIYVTCEEDKVTMQDYFSISDENVYTFEDYKAKVVSKKRKQPIREKLGKLEDNKVLCRNKTPDQGFLVYDVVDLNEGFVVYVDGESFDVSLVKDHSCSVYLQSSTASTVMKFCGIDKVVIRNKTNSRKLKLSNIKPLESVWKDNVNKVKAQVIKSRVWTGCGRSYENIYNQLVSHKIKSFKKVSDMSGKYPSVENFPDTVKLHDLGWNKTKLYNSELSKRDKLIDKCDEEFKVFKEGLPLYHQLRNYSTIEDMKYYLKLEKVIK